jgi:hypothetical protein
LEFDLGDLGQIRGLRRCGDSSQETEGSKEAFHKAADISGGRWDGKGEIARLRPDFARDQAKI